MNEDFKWTDELVIQFRNEGVNSKFPMEADQFLVDAFKEYAMTKKDKDYEVVEIINKHGGKITKAIDSLSWEDYCGLKSFDGFKINAVKRLSDGEVFTVGEDWLRYNEHILPIKEIKVESDVQNHLFLTCYCDKINGTVFTVPIEEAVIKLWPQSNTLNKKDWEIVSVTQGLGSYTDVDKNGMVRYAHFSQCSIEDALKNRMYKIHSVRRLSDNEVFKVGELVSNGIISYFKIDEHGMLVLFSSGDRLFLSDVKKFPPQSKPEQPNAGFKFSKESAVGIQFIDSTGFKSKFIIIPENKLSAATAAIERVLNDDEVADSIVPAKVYNQGIGDAMEVVKHHNDKLGLNFPVGLMSQLNDLKKDYLNHKSKQ